MHLPFHRAFFFAVRTASPMVFNERIDVEEKRKRSFFLICFFIALPILLIFTVGDIAQGNTSELLPEILVLAVLTSAVLALGQIRDARMIYRTSALIVGVLLLYFLALGSENGATILWSYTFPLFVFFLLSKFEGTLWNLGYFSAAVILVFLPGIFESFEYSEAVRWRFTGSFLLVFFFSYLLESFREHYYSRLKSNLEKLEIERENLDREKKHAESCSNSLEEAVELLEGEIGFRKQIEQEKETLIKKQQKYIEEIKTLQGILPICSSCKKIRDDHGYWQQLEIYIHDHSNADFSHGYCPECERKLLDQIDSM